MLFTNLIIKAEHRPAIKALTNAIEADRAGLGEFSTRLRKDYKALFDSLDELYPELKDYHYTIDHDDMTIVIIGRK